MPLILDKAYSLTRGMLLFLRPHAFMGTCAQALVIFLIAKAQMYQPSLDQFIVSFLAIVFMHIYGMGINHLNDIEIDKINKPHLPVAAGDIGIPLAWVITVASVIIALVFASQGGFYLTLSVSLLGIGLTAYSVPPIRLKKNPWLAALTIAVSRSFIYQGGFLLMYSQGGMLNQISPIESLFLGYVFVHTFIFGISKDVPDIKGDKIYNVKSFASKIGEERAAHLCHWAIVGLMLSFAGFSFFTAYFALIAISQLVFAAFIFIMFNKYKAMKSKRNFVNYYFSLWILFYLQLFVFAIATSL